MTTHNDESLKPCPCCGTAPWIHENKMWSIWCDGCGLRTGQHHTEDRAIAAWNRRAEQPQPVPTQSEWQSLAACMYQAAGAFDMPVRFLDALSAAQRGEPFAHLLRKLLPVAQPAPMQMDWRTQEAFDLVASMVEFAYDQGFHECGYNPMEVLQAALASRAEHAVPEGYVLVPTRATDEMRMYGQSAYDHAIATMQAHANRTGAIATAYATMIAAAPTSNTGE